MCLWRYSITMRGWYNVSIIGLLTVERLVLHLLNHSPKRWSPFCGFGTCPWLYICSWSWPGQCWSLVQAFCLPVVFGTVMMLPFLEWVQTVSATGNGGFWDYLWCGAMWLPLELVREILVRSGQVPSLINMPIMVFRKVFCPGWQGPTGHNWLSHSLLIPSPWLGLPGHTEVDNFLR